MKHRIEIYSNESSSLTFVGRCAKLLRQRGLWYTLKKAFYQYIYVFLFPSLKDKSFAYKGISLEYCNSRYNNSHSNERTIEVPIVLYELEKCSTANVLEIGNVLSHYVTPSWDIVDKYERRPGVVNADIVDFLPPSKYDLIVSISTFEHIGWDEQPRDPEKVLRAIECVQKLLTPTGRAIITFPISWNPVLDSILNTNNHPFTHVRIFRRAGWKNEWSMVPEEQQYKPSIGTYIGADFVAVCETCSFCQRANQ